MPAWVKQQWAEHLLCFFRNQAKVFNCQSLSKILLIKVPSQTKTRDTFVLYGETNFIVAEMKEKG